MSARRWIVVHRWPGEAWSSYPKVVEEPEANRIAGQITEGKQVMIVDLDSLATHLTRRTFEELPCRP